MVIAIDFDNTLCAPRVARSSYRMGAPEKGAVLSTQRLQADGHTIIIFTARNVQNPSAYKAVEDWLNYFKIPFHGITNVKRPEFDVMLDDRALRFENWPQAMSDITKLQNGITPHHEPSQVNFIKDITQPL